MVYVLLYVYTGRFPWSELRSIRHEEREYIKKYVEMRSSISSSDIYHGRRSRSLDIAENVRETKREGIPTIKDAYKTRAPTFTVEDGPNTKDLVGNRIVAAQVPVYLSNVLKVRRNIKRYKT